LKPTTTAGSSTRLSYLGTDFQNKDRVKKLPGVLY
ncbi:uncharacterized protein METZ01_LOCUS483285, partial [marine metagenome]